MATTSLSPQAAIVEAKPPVTDYITYLTIIEYNLSKDILPTLEGILRDDTELTVNIGWDLVHLLCPLLPEAQGCLQVLARQGNPREVILKVTESLRLLGVDDSGEVDDSEDVHPAIAAAREEERAAQLQEQSPASQLFVMQFQALLNMLTTLQPRINTKYPSRFLATTLQAVLVAYQRAGAQAPLLTDSVLALIKSLSGSARPHLPPRTSSGNIIASISDASVSERKDASEVPNAGEIAMQKRLLQSFITHLLEDYLLSLQSADDVPGLAWSSRYMEKTSPATIPDVPGRVTYAARFASDESLIARSSAVGQIVALARDLKLLDTAELLELCLDTTAESTGQPNHEDEPPTFPEDIPLSKTGALFLVAAGMARQTLFEAGGAPSPLTIFPQHETILKNYTGDLASVGSVNESVIDAILFLGLVSLEHNEVGEPVDDESFNAYLQIISLVSATCPSPSLRYHAHYLATTVLRSHPSDMVRLTFIRDTLEHCPYENLKASAVGWFKGETIEANLAPLMQSQGADAPSSVDPDDESVFASPVAMTVLGPYIFFDISRDVGPAIPLTDAWVNFKTNLTLYLTILNFYYFLLKAKPLHRAVGLKSLDGTRNISGFTLGPLQAAIDRFDKELAGGQLVSEEGEETEAVRAELGIFSELIENINSERAKLK